MLRRLYRCAVRLHPSSFRRSFGDEMLYIFDQQKGTLAAVGVTLDCVFSLLRQWTLRPRPASSYPLHLCQVQQRTIFLHSRHSMRFGLAHQRSSRAWSSR